MNQPKRGRSKVFICYSHKDSKWLERLQIHLKPLEREGRLERWDDTKIKSGTNWQEEIKKALSKTGVAVLLISPDFLASDFIAENELPPLLQAAQTEGTTILPVIVSPCRFSRTKLSEFQAVNDPEQPLSGLSQHGQEEQLNKLSYEIEDLIGTPFPQKNSNDQLPSEQNRSTDTDIDSRNEELEKQLRNTREELKHLQNQPPKIIVLSGKIEPEGLFAYVADKFPDRPHAHISHYQYIGPYLEEAGYDTYEKLEDAIEKAKLIFPDFEADFSKFEGEYYDNAYSKNYDYGVLKIILAILDENFFDIAFRQPAYRGANQGKALENLPHIEQVIKEYRNRL